MYFTFVNLIKKKRQKQINLIKKTAKKNISGKLSVKITFKHCGFVKKDFFFTFNLFKNYLFSQKTSISIKKQLF